MSVPLSPVHRLIEPPQLLNEALRWQHGERQSGDDDEVEAVVHEEDMLPVRGNEPSDRHWLAHLATGPQWETDKVGISGLTPQWGPYLPGQLLQQRLPRTFHESMEHIAVERRRAYGMPAGLSWGGWLPSASTRASLMENRARTFNEGVRPDYPTPLATPAAPFIRTPTWTSADSGEFGATVRDDPSAPLYVQVNRFT